MRNGVLVTVGVMVLGLLTGVCAGQAPSSGLRLKAPVDPEGYLEELATTGRKISFREVNRSNMKRLTEELRDVVDEKKRAEITKQLESVVGDVFDLDMKQREAELSQLEGRLKKLRAQLDHRREARTEIIQLEVKVLTNEAAGLGFSADGPWKKQFGIAPVWLGTSRSQPQPGDYARPAVK